MELKPYQQQVINDLGLFLQKIQETKNVSSAFYDFWTSHPRSPLQPYPGTAIEPYKDNVPGSPNVCVKVPTAGGKTFIACNAIKTIFDEFHYNHTKAVVWLVPSITILEQTLKNLKDPSHPYRQKINSQFGNKVEVFDKNMLLQGGGFNASSVRESLNIFVLSFDSLRAKNKEDRKVYQENSNLYSFKPMVSEEVSLMSVIQALNPVVIVDESHNAESELSIEMLKNLKPCFILDLTATPRKNSNIISFVDAIELKRENMVKLPVIVYNHIDKNDVIASAIQLQRKLETQAKEEEKNGGKYIRPIVLFQAQPKNAADNTTYERLKQKLVELRIPENNIKIKTANLNELKDINLNSRDCEVRYIITVNALKEGWDCPFAYVLASLADKSSAVDVEQILGRVLRQPYVKKHQADTLNLCYVLTASSKFLDTLDNIVKGLNKAGFSSKDFKVGEAEPQSVLKEISAGPEFSDEELFSDIDTDKISSVTQTTNSGSLNKIEALAMEQSRQFEETLHKIDSEKSIILPVEIQNLVKTYKIKDIFKEQAEALRLPQFFIKKSVNIFNEEDELLSKGDLLEGFNLSKADSNISFNSVTSELYRVDLDETKSDNTPVFVKLDGRVKDYLVEYILDPARKESRQKNLTRRIVEQLGNMLPLKQAEVSKYVSKVVEDFSDEQYNDFFNHEYTYVKLIKEKIELLSDEYAEKQFRNFLDTDKISMKPGYLFPMFITPGTISKNIAKSLYEQEGKMNPFEEFVINEIANLQSVAFWTRNEEKKQFCINGFINHYPDFIIQTKKGKTILLETKGDGWDNSDTNKKIRLGDAWEKKAGNNFRYYMVFEKKEVAGAHKLNDFLEKIKDL